MWLLINDIQEKISRWLSRRNYGGPQGQYKNTRDKQIGLPLRGRPILLSLVWLQTELDSTQPYYHYKTLIRCVGMDSENGLVFGNCFLHGYVFIFLKTSSLELSKLRPMFSKKLPV